MKSEERIREVRDKIEKHVETFKHLIAPDVLAKVNIVKSTLDFVLDDKPIIDGIFDTLLAKMERWKL